MKFVSWNVNGIRACLTKGFEERFQELDADIFCLQETKCQEGQVKLELPGYHQYWNYANRRGYSGTAIFTKQEPLSVFYGIEIEEHDKEGRVITLEFENFYFVTVYTPNSQSELRRLEYRMEWERDFLAYLLGLQEKKPVICCGDLKLHIRRSTSRILRQTVRMPALQTRREHALQRFLRVDLSIHSAIFIRIRREAIPGGPTASRRVRRTQDGGLTILSFRLH